MNNVQLSDREINVLKMITQGCDNASIAEELGVETPTAGRYVWFVRRKTGLPNRAAMMALTAKQIEDYRRPVLTPRQKQIVILVAHGLSNEQIARKMKPRLALKTIEVHMHHIFRRLGIESRVQLAIYALKAGLLRLEDIDLP